MAKHGYRLSPGTLYPVLHTLEEGGWLTSEKRVVGGKIRKYYQSTPAGRETLIQGREKAEVLLRELRE